VIRGFLNILNIIRQNPEIDKCKLFVDVEITDERPHETTIIEEL
jgi:hypothetical protein